MKRRAFLVAILMVCAVIAVHAVAFNPFGYAESVRDSGAIIDVGVGYGWAFDIHATFDKLFPIAAGSNTLPLSFGGNVDVAFGGLGFGFSVDARALWHVDLGIPELDLYAGPSLGFWGYHLDLLDEFYPGFDYGGVAGARWAFSKSMAAFFETGYTGLTYAKAGITFIL